MAKNEDGEFELVLGNNQLLSVFVLMVLLLVVCFVGGYFLGRKATPVLTAAATANAAPTVESSPDSEPTKIVDATKPSADGKKEEPAPVRTAPQSETETAVPEPPKAEPVKPEPKKEEPKKEEPKKAEIKAKAPEPAKAKSEPAKTKLEPPKVDAKAGKQPSAAGQQPIPGRIYLQLSATEKDKADVMVDLLRRRNLPGLAAAIPDRPGLYRVLVGPLAETGIADMKAQLKAGGFPADEAIRRQF